MRDNVINDAIDEQLQATTTATTTAVTTAATRRLYSVDDWLTDIKMTRYRENFARCGYTQVDQLMTLTRRELATRLGVCLVGHQKKMLNSLRAPRDAAAADVDSHRTPRSADPLLA